MVFAIACGPEEPAASIEATYVGRADDEQTFVAAIRSGTSFLVYACDDAHGAWFDAESLVSPMELTNEAGDRVSLAIDDESAIGELTLAGAESGIVFELERTEEEVLFRADESLGGEPIVGGWIRLPDGEQRGVVTRGSDSSASRLVIDERGVSTDGPFSGRLVPAVFTPRALTTPTRQRAKRFDLYALGDSYGAGEGAPEIPGNYLANGDLEEDGAREVWNASLNAAGEREARGCHRSGVSGVELAADLLEAQYAGSVDMRLQSYACSGATTEHLLECSYRGAVGDHFTGGDDPLQRPQIERLTADSRASGVDAVYMSIGGNDMRFGYLMSECLADRCGPGSAIETEFLDAVDRMRARYSALDTALEPLVPSSDAIYISAYPNPAVDENDDPCSEIDIFDFEILGSRVGVIGSTDVAWLSDTIHSTLNQTVLNAAFENRWTFIDAHVDTFVGHGYCSDDPWFHDNPSSLRVQGHHMSDSLRDCDFPIDTCIDPAEQRDEVCFSATDPSFLSTVGGSIVHPTHDGYALGYAPAIADAMRARVERHIQPPPPTNLRIQNQARDGGFTLAWDDRSSTETEYRVRVVYDSGTRGVPADLDDRFVLPADAQSADIPLSSRASGTATVTACVVGPRPERHEVCSLPRTIQWTNFAPSGVPRSVRIDTSEAASIPVGRRAVLTPHRQVKVRWTRSTEVGLVYYDVELTSSDGTVQRLATTQDFLVASATLSSARVRACNFAGCSEASVAATGGPSCTAEQVFSTERRCVSAMLPEVLAPRELRPRL